MARVWPRDNSLGLETEGLLGGFRDAGLSDLVCRGWPVWRLSRRTAAMPFLLCLTKPPGVLEHQPPEERAHRDAGWISLRQAQYLANDVHKSCQLCLYKVPSINFI